MAIGFQRTGTGGFIENCSTGQYFRRGLASCVREIRGGGCLGNRKSFWEMNRAEFLKGKYINYCCEIGNEWRYTFAFYFCLFLFLFFFYFILFYYFYFIVLQF